MILSAASRYELRKTFHLAWPISLSLMTHVLIGVIDSLMIGPIGVTPLAASAFASTIFGFATIVCVGFMSAVAPLIAEARGRGKQKECGALLWHGLAVNITWALLLWGVLVFLSNQMAWFNQPKEVIPLAREYLLIVAPTIVTILIFGTFRQFSEGLSFAKPVTFFLALSVLLNTFLNWLLIYGNAGFPRMELAGAAWATTLTRLITMGSFIAFILWHRRFRPYLCRPRRSMWKKVHFRKLLKLGLPAGIQYAAEGGVFSAAAILMGWLGENELAAHQIAIGIASFTFMMAMGVSAASSIGVGEALGQKNFLLLRRRGMVGLLLGGAFMMSSALLFLFGHDWIPTWYVDDPAVISIASRLLLLAALFQVCDGLQAVAVGVLRGMQDVAWPTGITIFAYWGLGFPLCYYLSSQTELRAQGVWWGLCFSLTFSSLLLMARFHLKSRKLLEN